MPKAGGKKGLIISSRPREYEMTEQQKKIRMISEVCGIQKGMSKETLMTRMVDCVGPRMSGKMTIEEYELKQKGSEPETPEAQPGDEEGSEVKES